MSIGIKAIPIIADKSNEQVGPDIIAKDVASFTAWWTRSILPTLNGFPGLDTVKWNFTKETAE